ncbi:DUF4234 domain-containing protein [Candidatus Pacearchaeota archaeon]|nr:DUF4234 domain-containing protein [Candidatus Pacearchaeota archaeon]
MVKQIKEVKQLNTITKNNQQVPQKKSVILLWFLSFITLGIYSSIWYIKRARELDYLKTPKKLKKRVGILNLILIILCLTLLTTLTITSPTEIDITNTLTIILVSSLLILMFFTLIVTLFLAFKTRTIINQALKNKGVTRNVSGFFTLIFNFLYLQYEINRIVHNKENLFRTGPWVIFILFVLLPILIAITFIILTIVIGITLLN